MTVNERIRAALLPFGDPVFAAVATGDVQRYYAFNYTTLGADYADNDPSHERYLIQVHFFCPNSYDTVERVKQTKRSLRSAGMTWPEMTNASDENGQHVVFECEYAEGIDLDGDI